MPQLGFCLDASGVAGFLGLPFGFDCFCMRVFGWIPFIIAWISTMSERFFLNVPWFPCLLHGFLYLLHCFCFVHGLHFGLLGLYRFCMVSNGVCIAFLGVCIDFMWDSFVRKWTVVVGVGHPSDLQRSVRHVPFFIQQPSNSIGACNENVAFACKTI